MSAWPSWAVPVIDGGEVFSGAPRGTATLRELWALGPPLRLIVWPVKTCVVDVPAESVSVSVTV